jgi:hypothetical protein
MSAKSLMYPHTRMSSSHPANGIARLSTSLSLSQRKKNMNPFNVNPIEALYLYASEDHHIAWCEWTDILYDDPAATKNALAHLRFLERWSEFAYN